MIRNFQNKKIRKLNKVESIPGLFEIIQVNTDEGSERFTYVGKGYFIWDKPKKSVKLVISGPRNLNEFLL